MTGAKTKKKNLADPGSGLWLSYSIDRKPSASLQRRFGAPEQSEQSETTAPEVRERIFSDELRQVASSVRAHKARPMPSRPADVRPASPPEPKPRIAAPRPPEGELPEVEAPVATAPVQEAPRATPPEPAMTPAVQASEPAPVVIDQTPDVAPQVEPEAQPAAATPTPAPVTEPAAETSVTPTRPDDSQPSAPVVESEEPPQSDPPATAETVPEPQAIRADSVGALEPEAAPEATTVDAAPPATDDEAPDLILFPDRLDDAEEIRGLSAGGESGSVRSARNELEADEDEIDEIELEDPEEGDFEPPETVATDLAAGRVEVLEPSTEVKASVEPEVSHEAAEPEAPAAAVEPETEATIPEKTETDTETIAEPEPEQDEPVDRDQEIGGRSAKAFRSSEEYNRKVAEIRAAAAEPESLEDQLPEPIIRELPEDQAVPQALPIETIQSNFRQAEYAYPEEFVDLFKNLYSARTELKVEQLDPVLEFLLEKSGAQAIAWLVLDRRVSAYRPYMDKHLDLNTRKNLYFTLKDRYLPDEDMYEILRFDGNLKHDFHFRKRFSTPFLLGHKCAVIINLNILQQSSYILLFYKRLPPDDIIEKLDRESLPVVRDLLPAVQRLQEEAESGLRSQANIADLMYNTVREMTNYGRTPLRVLHFQFPDILKKSSRLLLIEKLTTALKGHLATEERILCLPPGRLVVLLQKTDQAVVTEMVRDLCYRWGMEAQTTSYRFPDRGMNLFNYLEPGQ